MKIDKKFESENGTKKVLRWALEPALFMLFFGWYLSTSITENQILKQTCSFTKKYDDSVCSHLDVENKTLEQEIQPYALNVLMATSIFYATIPTVLNLFLGPWSDKYGRKKIFNVIFIGCAITMSSLTTVSYHSDYVEPNSPWNYFFAQLPFMLAGAIPLITTIILCYVTDITDEDSRSRRFIVFQLIVTFASFLAFASSSFILKLTNATTTYAISLACISVGCLIVIIFVKESANVKKDVKVSTQLKEIFTINQVKEFYSTFVQQRPFRQRKILFIIALLLLLTSFVTTGKNTIFYFFVRQGFGWNQQDFTFFYATSMLMCVVGAAVAVSGLKKFLNTSDLALAALSVVSMFLDAMIKIVASESWHIYLSAVADLFRLITAPMLQSIISSIVAPSEVSRLYSITTAIQALAGLLAAPFYKIVYAATLTSFPAAFNLISIVIIVFCLVLVVLLAKLLPKSELVSTTTVDTKL